MNSNTIPQTSPNKLYVAHSVKEKNEKKEPLEQPRRTNAPEPSDSVQPYQYASRNYYNDSVGGGYQGL